MIVAFLNKIKPPEFEELLLSAQGLVEAQAEFQPKHYLSMGPTDFEVDVKEKMDSAAKGGSFEGKIDLISGHKFPDIVANSYYGVEVKTTRQDHWKTTGNSVLETTRVDKVESIYMFFGKLTSPPQFKFKKYEDCLYDVAVTHSPRYLVDMDAEQTIFKRLNISYGNLRKKDNPIKPIMDYYRKNLKEGQSLWWLDTGDSSPPTSNMIVRFWGDLNGEEQNTIRSQGMALFPEIFGAGNKKYRKYAVWLMESHGVIDSSLRDRFSSGGQVSLNFGGANFQGAPKVFHQLKKNVESIVKHLLNLDDSAIEYYWGQKVPRSKRLKKWIDETVQHSLDNNTLRMNKRKKNVFKKRLEKELRERSHGGRI